MIKSALSNTYCWCFLAQFWAPVTIDGRRLLSTSRQPFALRPLSNKVAQYRLLSEKYKYNIDMNKLHIEPEHMILSGGPATAFRNCRASIDKAHGFLLELNDKLISVMVPICLPFKRNCIGVLEFLFDDSEYKLASFLVYTVEGIKKAGLDVFYVQHLIPYKAISGLEVAKDEIEEALKVVCETHNLVLAQVWIPYEDKYNVPFSYSLEDSKTKRLLAIKLTGYLYGVYAVTNFEKYFRFGDITPRAIEEELLLVTLQDYKPRYISKLRSNKVIGWDFGFPSPPRALAICLRSNDTGDFNYAFEFIWTYHSNYKIFLEAILLTLKRCLPRFKFASGTEVGDELDIHNKDDGTKFKIFRRKRSMVVDDIAHSEVICKTTPKVLPREVIEKQFGKTMNDAAKDLNVSLSTFKRKFKELDIPEWPGPNFMKRNINDLSAIQMNTNEEDNGAIEYTSTVNLNKNELTIKAEYEDDMIKFNLPILQATLVNIKKEIGKKLELSDKTYKLKYLDEDGDWITLKSDEKMTDCIKSSRKSGRIVVRMRVLPSAQPISGPN
ncbi:putative transcription factor Nin-like family [Helianthus annuus]|nr:putative transcription factor Nin-like family [Helianthus annuus]